MLNIDSSKITVNTIWSILVEFHACEQVPDRGCEHWHTQFVVTLQSNLQGLSLVQNALDEYANHLIDSTESDGSDTISIPMSSTIIGEHGVESISIDVDLDHIEEWLRKHLVKFKIVNVDYDPS